VILNKNKGRQSKINLKGDNFYKSKGGNKNTEH